MLRQRIADSYAIWDHIAARIQRRQLRTMAFRGVFIGVNEYSDLDLHNLDGARLDAVALHALFRDSVEGVEAQLLVDGDATRKAVVEAVASTLGNATRDDTVLLTFSGHGSAELGLLLSDSTPSVPSSCLSMAEIAEYFRGTRARSAIVLLDCCESGEGPLQALNLSVDSAGTDEMLRSSEGGARVMIAAANSLQSAWESGSVHGHGLLTASLMGILESANEAVDVRALALAAADRVRAEAARLGQQQNTVDLLAVSNGFALQPLRRGRHFEAAFPERAGIIASGPFLELERFGIPRIAAEAWANEYAEGLNELQLAAINEKRLLHGENIVIVAPTSSGKTLLGEMAAMRAVGTGRRAVFLVPYRALASEQMQTFERRYGGDAGARIIRCTGDYADTASRFVRGKYDVAVLTYEMFLGIALSSPTSLTHIGAVVVDEAHFIADPERGIVLELLLTLLIADAARGAYRQIVALSAVIGETNHFEDWLKAGLLVHTKRPVPLVEGVIDRSGRYRYLGENGDEHETQLVPRHEIVQRRAEPSAQDVLVPLARTLLKKGTETLLVFRSIKGQTAGCARYLGDALSLPGATAALLALPTTASSTESTNLRHCLSKGTAFHNGNLDPEEKAVIENAFRDGREVRALVATTGLAAGVNTPATTVVIVEHAFPWQEAPDFTVAVYKNMAGRAGRPGFADRGRSILYAETQIERDALFRKYVKGVPEQVHSSFDPEDTDTWLLRLLCQEKVRGIEEERVPQLLANTFGGYTRARRDPNWVASMEREVARRISRMRGLGLLGSHRGKLVLTRLGEACGQSSLALDSCMELVELLQLCPRASAIELMALVQCLEEASVYTPLQRGKAGRDRTWDRAIAPALGYGRAVEAMARGCSIDEFCRRCKRTAVLLDWIDGSPMESIERRFSINAFNNVQLGTVQSFANGTRWFLRSSVAIACVLPEYAVSLEESVGELVERLERGLPSDLLKLGRRANGLMREEILRLANEGLRSPEAVANASEAALVRVLGRERSRLLETAGIWIGEPTRPEASLQNPADVAKIDIARENSAADKVVH